MSLQASPSNVQEQPTERPKPSKPTGRLRFACDSCHQAKIRCSGRNPCLTCQVSQVLCIYSPGSQPGRPKGSKNKRTLLQQNKVKQAETEEDRNNRETDALQWTEPVEYNLEHGFDTTFAEDLLSPNLASLIDSLSGARVNTTSEDDLSTFFAQASAEYRTLPFEALDSNCDSGYATGTASSSADDTNLPSPHNCNLLTPFIESNHCSCLQLQIQLVYQLGDLPYSHAGSPTIDLALHGVQLAQAPWKILMQCSQCRSQDNQKEVFLLFAMSIRILLSSFQKLDASNVGVSVGSFELTGETKIEVINVAIQRALQSITTALLHLRERFSPTRLLPMAPESPNSRILNSISTESQKALDIDSLLNTLQFTMEAMKQGLGTD